MAENHTKEHEAVSPEGRRIAISEKLFNALTAARDMKLNGGMELEVRNGGVAGVKITWRME